MVVQVRQPPLVCYAELVGRQLPRLLHRSVEDVLHVVACTVGRLFGDALDCFYIGQ